MDPPVIPSKSDSITIRRLLVDSAINFLTNSRLSMTTPDQKHRFLREKGLTPDEIDLAVQLANGRRPPTEVADEINQIIGAGPLNRLYRAIHFILVFGGFLYGAKWLLQNHLLPWLDEKRFPKPRNAEQKICERIDQLQEQVSELARNLVVVHEFVQTYCQFRDESIGKLRNDLNSIKGLLVNKNQFPPVPNITSWEKNPLSHNEH